MMMFADRVTILDGATETPSRAHVEPLSSTEAVLTASTVISRRRCLVPPTDAITSASAVRWDDQDYQVDGAVGRHKLGGRVRHLSVILKVVT